MPAANLVNQNDFIQVRLSPLWNGAIAVQTAAGVNALAVFLVELSGNEQDVITARPRDAAAAGIPDIASVNGPNKVVWLDCPGYIFARVRRSDANGGNGNVWINFREG
jgi:hypothetical protein